MMGGNVYFIRDGVGHMKIGIAQDVQSRLNDLQVANPMQLEIYRVLEVGNMGIAREMEQTLHTIFKNSRIRGEWFFEDPIIELFNRPSFVLCNYEFKGGSIPHKDVLKVGTNIKKERGYSLKDVADILGYKVRTMRQWVHDGKMKAVKPAGGKQWMVLESEVRRLQNGNTD